MEEGSHAGTVRTDPALLERIVRDESIGRWLHE